MGIVICSSFVMAATNNPYSELTSNVHSALDELNADESHYVPQREAEELFYLPDCVHIFSSEPMAKSPRFPSHLHSGSFDSKMAAHRPVTRPRHPPPTSSK